MRRIEKIRLRMSTSRRRTTFVGMLLLLLAVEVGPAMGVETPLGENGGGTPDNGSALLLQEDDTVEQQLELEDEIILEAVPPPEGGDAMLNPPASPANSGAVKGRC